MPKKRQTRFVSKCKEKLHFTPSMFEEIFNLAPNVTKFTMHPPMFAKIFNSNLLLVFAHYP
jgi:hypothetical protein